MTTQFVILTTYSYGATPLTATLRIADTDALVATADSVTETASGSGIYTAVFGEVSVIAAGVYRIRAVASGSPINRYVTLTGVDLEKATSRIDRAAELDSAARVKLAAVQPDYAPATVAAVAAEAVKTAAIKTTTDKFAFTVPNQVDANSLTVNSLTASDLANIIAGVQAVSAGIALAQSNCGLYITTGDTWIQDVNNLGNLNGKTVAFVIKTNFSDTDNNAIVYLDQTAGLTRLNSAACLTTTLGDIEILSVTEGNIRLRLESSITAQLPSGAYFDGIKIMKTGYDTTVRNQGKTMIKTGTVRATS